MAIQHFLQSGQRTCHDEAGFEVPCAGTGQDAAVGCGVPWPEPRFEIQDNEVTDLLSGLTWSRDANLAEFPLTWQEALAFVAGMNRDQCFGRSDWRLPNRRELRSLMSLQTKKPALPERHPFTNVFHGCIGLQPPQQSAQRTPGMWRWMARACSTAAKINHLCCGRYVV